MIIRQALIRHGRRLPVNPRRAFSRPFASQIDRIEQSIESSLKKTHSIESQLQDYISNVAPAVDNEAKTIAYGASAESESEAVRAYRTLKHQEATTAHFGSTIAPHYQPYRLLTDPIPPADVTLADLLAAQAHLGHSTALWNPANARYIFGARHGIHIIGLEHTAAHLRRAARVVHGVARRAGLVLFVGTRPGQARAVVAAARDARGFHLFERWTPGALSNPLQVRPSGGAGRVKAVDEFDREIAVEDGGIADNVVREVVAPLRPDLVVCLNPLENYVMLRECGQLGVPTIGIIDTDADPTWVTYPIPANDDSLRCAHLIAGVLGAAGREGQEERRKLAMDGKILYEPVNLKKLKDEFE